MLAEPTHRYYQPIRLRNRHLAIMELLVAKPEADQNELAEELGMTPSRLSIIVNSPLFVYAFKEYRREHMAKVSDLAAEATTAALTFSKEVIENKNVDIPVRQASARDILSQGHARAIERKATLNMDVPISQELLAGLGNVLGEIQKPFVPTRQLSVPALREEEDSKDE